MVSVGNWQGMNKRKKEVEKKENIIILLGTLGNIITEMSNLLCAFLSNKAQKLKYERSEVYFMERWHSPWFCFQTLWYLIKLCQPIKYLSISICSF